MIRGPRCRLVKQYDKYEKSVSRGLVSQTFYSTKKAFHHRRHLLIDIHRSLFLGFVYLFFSKMSRVLDGLSKLAIPLALGAGVLQSSLYDVRGSAASPASIHDC